MVKGVKKAKELMIVERIVFVGLIVAGFMCLFPIEGKLRTVSLIVSGMLTMYIGVQGLMNPRATLDEPK